MGEEDRKRQRAEHPTAGYKVPYSYKEHMYHTNLCIRRMGA